MQDLKVLGERIRAARKRAGLNQTELGMAVGVEIKTISRWEQGQRSPRVEELQKLAEVLDTTAEYLLSGRSDETSKTMRGDMYTPAKQEPSYKDFSTTTRGNLRYNFGNGKELEVPNTPETAPLFWAIVNQALQPQATAAV